MNEPSSTDLLVVAKISAPMLQRLMKRFEQEMGHEINYTLMTPDEFIYRRDITDRFLYSILEGKKIVMVDKYVVTV